MNKLLLVLLGVVLLSSCVSKKKYDELLSNSQSSQDSLANTLTTANEQILALRLDLANKQGANEALIGTQERLQDRLDVLQREIDRLNQSASNQAENLGGQLEERASIIAAKQAIIDETKAIIAKQQERLQTLGNLLKDSLAIISGTGISFSPRRNELSIDIGEDLLFQKGSTSRVKEDGRLILSKIVEVLESYPEMLLLAIGHTDNQPVKRKSLNNWQYTALRAVTIVEILSGENGLGTNRVMVASKGEYEPRSSNETEDGRAKNRRIEIRVVTDQRALLRELDKSLNRS